MPIRFRCCQCQTVLSIGTRKAHTQTNCPRCKAEQTVPGVSDPDAVKGATSKGSPSSPEIAIDSPDALCTRSDPAPASGALLARESNSPGAASSSVEAPPSAARGKTLPRTGPLLKRFGTQGRLVLATAAGLLLLAAGGLAWWMATPSERTADAGLTVAQTLAKQETKDDIVPEQGKSTLKPGPQKPEAAYKPGDSLPGRDQGRQHRLPSEPRPAS
jgi:hypothetical protein